MDRASERGRSRRRLTALDEGEIRRQRKLAGLSLEGNPAIAIVGPRAGGSTTIAAHLLYMGGLAGIGVVGFDMARNRGLIDCWESLRWPEDVPTRPAVQQLDTKAPPLKMAPLIPIVDGGRGMNPSTRRPIEETFENKTTHEFAGSMATLLIVAISDRISDDDLRAYSENHLPRIAAHARQRLVISTDTGRYPARVRTRSQIRSLLPDPFVSNERIVLVPRWTDCPRALAEGYTAASWPTADTTAAVCWRELAAFVFQLLARAGDEPMQWPPEVFAATFGRLRDVARPMAREPRTKATAKRFDGRVWERLVPAIQQLPPPSGVATEGDGTASDRSQSPAPRPHRQIVQVSPGDSDYQLLLMLTETLRISRTAVYKLALAGVRGTRPVGPLRFEPDPGQHRVPIRLEPDVRDEFAALAEEWFPNDRDGRRKLILLATRLLAQSKGCLPAHMDLPSSVEFLVEL